MSDNTEDHTIRLLQEMRAEMRQGFESLNAHLDATNARLDDANTRLEGLAYIRTMLAGHVRQQDARIEKLENRAE